MSGQLPQNLFYSKLSLKIPSKHFLLSSLLILSVTFTNALVH